MTTGIDSDATDRAALETPPPAAAPGRLSWRFRDMRLKVGDRVQIELPVQLGSARVSARVVGWVEGYSLVLTLPHTSAGRLCLHAGEKVVVRVFTGRSAFAFGCSVLRSTLKPPCDYLHLSFPDVIDGVDVRSSPRVRIGLAAMVTPAGGGEAVAATIDNIGSTGALLVSQAPLGSPGGRIRVAFELVLHEVPISLALEADIRSEDAGEGGHFRHGVAFVEPSPNDRLVLAALVWFNMYENPKLST
jgi:hypothetical protein